MRTLNRYLSSYNEGGFPALMPQGRSCRNRKIPDELVEAAIQLRLEVPERSVLTIIQILELEGKAPPGFLKRTTLQDALMERGYSAEMMKNYISSGYGSQRFQHPHRNDLWQGDIKFGPILKIDGQNTYLCCLIDDSSRYIRQIQYSEHDGAILGALQRIYEFSGGIPSLINRACTQTLTYAYQGRLNIIDDHMVDTVLEAEVSQ